MRVIAAMSGGVDSSVAAARMVDAGHEVVGVHLALSRSGTAAGAGSRGCCTLDDARDARRVADQLGIPFYVWDLSERFRDDVIADFVDEYRNGRTPNPCLRCNEKIKFSAVLDRALAMDFDAGGHRPLRAHRPGTRRTGASSRGRSRPRTSPTCSAFSRRRSSPIRPSRSAATSRTMIRDEAERRGLLVARKPDSHDICFIPDGDTAAFVRSRVGAAPGDIVDAETGEVLAHHEGAHAFTIGQRRGLNLRVPAADGAPRYVVDVDIVTSTVRVGPPELLDVDGIEGIRVVWAGPPVGTDPVDVEAQVRAHGAPGAGARPHGRRPAGRRPRDSRSAGWPPGRRSSSTTAPA